MASNSGVSDIPTSNNNQPTNHITPALGVFTIIWFLTILITAIITHRQRSHLLRQIASLRSKLWDLPPGAKLADHHLYQQQQLQKQQQQEEEQDPVVLDSSSASTVQANTVEQASTIFIPGGGNEGFRVTVDDSKEAVLVPLPVMETVSGMPQMEKVGVDEEEHIVVLEKKMEDIMEKAVIKDVNDGTVALPTPSIRTEITIPHYLSIPTLLLVTTCNPRHAHLWPRHFLHTRIRFPPSSHLIATNFSPTSPHRLLFASPQSNPLGSRVHNLIMAAITADLHLLETRLTSLLIQLPPATWAFMGFQLLAGSIYLVGAPQKWEPGLAVLLTLIATMLGMLVLVCVIIRDSVTELKAELVVLHLTLERIEARAPYTLDFAAVREVVDMKWDDWTCGPLFGGFLVLEWAVALLAKRRRRAVGGLEAVEVVGGSAGCRAPRGLDGVGRGRDQEQEDGCGFWSGTLRPPVWKITVNLNPHIFNPHHHDMHQPSLSSLAPRGRFREGDAWSDDERMEPMGAVAIVTTREE